MFHWTQIFLHVRVICGFEEACMLTEETLELCCQAQCLNSSNARGLSFPSADTSFTYTTSGPAAKGSGYEWTMGGTRSGLLSGTEI